MLLPKDIIEKLYYYHVDYYNGICTDKITVVYQGWLFKKTKKFNFTRQSKASKDGKFTTHTMTDECHELITQLHDVMKENLKEENLKEENLKKDENEE